MQGKVGHHATVTSRSSPEKSETKITQDRRKDTNQSDIISIEHEHILISHRKFKFPIEGIFSFLVTKLTRRQLVWRVSPLGLTHSNSIKRLLSLFATGLCGIVSIAYLILHLPLHIFYDPAEIECDSNSLYVPGAGFSGFWFTLGGLEKIDSSDYSFFCYSSGCLAVLAKMVNRSFYETREICDNIRTSILQGSLSRYDAVDKMFDMLLSEQIEKNSSQEYLEKINVLITSRSKGVVVRKACNIAQLKELIISTTWIPYITGGSMWALGDDGDVHIDGAFSKYLHPHCDYRFGNIPLSFIEMHLNTLNWNLDFNQTQTYWELGQRQNILFNQDNT